MKTAIAMSGGVDSSVAALLLKEEGRDVIGLTMALRTGDEAAADARRVAAELGMPLEVIPLAEDFGRSVVDYFVKEYAAGRTPNPCVVCNPSIKFGRLLDEARRLGASELATGHYARVVETPVGCSLLRGADTSKDQSYFLYRLSQEQLAHAVMPVGRLTKREVRETARVAGLHVSERPGSADACFVPDGDLEAFLKSRVPQAVTPGPILDVAGRTLGRHRGIALYTVGQRTGLGLSRPRPSYVLTIDVARNAILAGDEEGLFRDRLTASQLSWVRGDPPAPSFRARAKIRSTGEPAACRVDVDRHTVSVCFMEPQRAVAPGQSVVFYDGDAVVGGGVILSE